MFLGPRGDQAQGGFEVRLRLMALLFLGVGAFMTLIVANTSLRFDNEYAGADGPALDALGTALSVLGLAVLVFPWHRFGRRTFFVVPAAATVVMALIIAYSGAWDSFGYELLVLVCAFYGLYFDRWTAAAGVVGVVVAGLVSQPISPDTIELMEYLLVHVPIYVSITVVSGYMTRQVSLREAQKERLRAEASIDGLTGLANRRELEERLEEELARMRRYGYPLSLLFMDLDDFKRVNDEYGHLVGDEVLRLVASTLRPDLRAVDTAARYGGEEFVLLLPNTDREGANVLFKRMRRDLARISEERLGFPITMSAGVVEARRDAQAAELLALADEAMYRAKRRGKDRLSS